MSWFPLRVSIAPAPFPETKEAHTQLCHRDSAKMKGTLLLRFLNFFLFVVGGGMVREKGHLCCKKFCF